jgi:hypothetical protein
MSFGMYKASDPAMGHETDYFQGRVAYDALALTVSAATMAAAVGGEIGGVGTCIFTAGGGCLIAATSAGIMVVAGARCICIYIGDQRWRTVSVL